MNKYLSILIVAIAGVFSLAYPRETSAADCGTNNANGIATAVRGWHLLRLKMSQVTGGYGFSVESATEGGTGDYAQFVSKERQSTKFSLAMEFQPCTLTEANLAGAFDRYYQELKYIAQTFPGVGEGNLIQFPTCPAPSGANAARNTVVSMLGRIYTAESDTQQFLKTYAANPPLWDSYYKGQIDSFALSDCAEWITPSIVALWYAAHAMTIVNMQGMSRFPDWNKSAQVMEISNAIRTKLPSAFRTMVFRVNQGQTICGPSN
jgi:hypothetical protein